MRFLTLLIAGLAATAHALAATDDATQLTALLAGLKSAQGHFEQQLTDAKGKQLQASSGEFAVQKPGKFRWDTQQPFPQLLVSNGDTLWLFDPDLEQASQSRVNAKATETPALLLSGDADKLAQNFDITQRAPQAQAGQIFELAAKDKQASFSHISATFEKGSLVAMAFVDKIGNTTSFHFSELQANASLDASLFEFTPSDGTDVIHND